MHLKSIEKIELDPKDLEFAENNLGESDEIRINSISEIRAWLEENPKINSHTDEDNLLYFLRGCKFNLEKTKKKISYYYKMRAERIEFFQGRNPLSPEIVALLDIGVFLPIKEKDDLNRQVVIVRTGAHNPKVHKLNDVLKVSKMILDLLLCIDPSISIYGIVAIFDMSNVTIHHALQITRSFVKRAVASIENYPCRPQLLEFMNAPIHVNIILNIFRSFMSSKMRGRVTVHRCPNPVFTKVILPFDLGGSGPSYRDIADNWKKILQDNKQWFENDEKYKSVL